MDYIVLWDTVLSFSYTVFMFFLENVYFILFVVLGLVAIIFTTFVGLGLFKVKDMPKSSDSVNVSNRRYRNMFSWIKNSVGVAHDVDGWSDSMLLTIIHQKHYDGRSRFVIERQLANGSDIPIELASSVDSIMTEGVGWVIPTIPQVEKSEVVPAVEVSEESVDSIVAELFEDINSAVETAASPISEEGARYNKIVAGAKANPTSKGK